MSELGDAMDQWKLLDVENMDDRQWRRIMWHELVEARRESRESSAKLLSQAEMTNGRVSSLESWRDRGVGAVGILTLFVVPIVGWIIWLAAQGEV